MYYQVIHFRQLKEAGSAVGPARLGHDDQSREPLFFFHPLRMTPLKQLPARHPSAPARKFSRGGGGGDSGQTRLLLLPFIHHEEAAAAKNPFGGNQSRYLTLCGDEAAADERVGAGCLTGAIKKIPGTVRAGAEEQCKLVSVVHSGTSSACFRRASMRKS